MSALIVTCWKECTEWLLGQVVTKWLYMLRVAVRTYTELRGCVRNVSAIAVCITDVCMHVVCIGQTSYA